MTKIAQPHMIMQFIKTAPTEDGRVLVWTQQYAIESDHHTHESRITDLVLKVLNNAGIKCTLISD